MSDISTTTPLSAEAHQFSGHGRHRGPVSAQESEAAPHGRHRKPSEQAPEQAWLGGLTTGHGESHAR
ncbi:hypothetical protein [Streptomyces sp. NPDC007264]|uniref:hypothetical protein n=1 Tax=Streptomyces sp. NPDC007264 TaxID=3364777 RepID=UPI0036DCC10D